MFTYPQHPSQDWTHVYEFHKDNWYWITTCPGDHVDWYVARGYRAFKTHGPTDAYCASAVPSVFPSRDGGHQPPSAPVAAVAASTNADENCVKCGRNHLNCNVWHIHHHDQVICEEHFNSGLSEVELSDIRKVDAMTSPHPEWFPRGRKNIGMRAYFRALENRRVAVHPKDALLRAAIRAQRCCDTRHAYSCPRCAYSPECADALTLADAAAALDYTLFWDYGCTVMLRRLRDHFGFVSKREKPGL